MPGTTPSMETRLVEAILEAIADGRLEPGARLGEQALCDLFGSNRTQVRRALSTLAGCRAVIHHPNRGSFVASPSAAEAQDVFEARRAMEATIARGVAARAAETDLARLRAHLEEERAVRRTGARTDQLRLSRAFHLELARAAGNRVLADYLAELTLRTTLILGLYGREATCFCGTDEHAGILEAVTAGDGERAAALMRDHLDHIEAALVFEARAPQTPLARAFADRRRTG